MSNSIFDKITAGELIEFKDNAPIKITVKGGSYEDCHKPENQNLVDGIPLDPVLPDHFEQMEHAFRSKEEIQDWWGRPFIITNGNSYMVRVLNGGAHDRSCGLGVATSLEEDIAIAQTGRRV
ncbi:MAG: hypothetical protein CMH98_03760 [Oceanospirillaceae bacterium]|nr:hypothetical protein [Oceanospirillaceae bacterium]